MARPKKSPEERLTDQFNVRLRTTTRARIELEANAYGLDATEYARRILEKKRMPPATRIQQQQTATFGTALIRLCNNLNQVAKHMNAGRSAPPDLSALIARINAELDRLYDPGHPGGREIV